MKKAALTLIIAGLIASTSAFARVDHAKAANHRPNVAERIDHRVAYLATVLSLTSAQQQQAKTIFMNAANANSAVFANLKAERLSLSKAVSGNEPASTIAEISNTIGNDAGKLVATRAMASEEFHKTLTAEQQTKFARLQHEVHGWGHGFGAFGGGRS
jgi:Spy/CpxP family protein refolding chaperone